MSVHPIYPNAFQRGLKCTKGHHIPDSALFCPTCATAKGNEALAAIQAEFLRKAASGEFGYTLRVMRDGSGYERHVLMFTSRSRTFCGEDLKVNPQIVHEPYGAATLAKVCVACRIAITSALAEALAQ